ncbi:DUF2690 domain-containing protein [Streptomyces sp. TRM68367]|uniref:DUF2690 domain-containing protein n=1 Tax=Streptomyces sp. TRM68367 TaxID=2758415 RepID=UPI00165B2C83|nr:DUF2690 domain-containing protein [Streptomyces sp. TRM68367]MBC9727675.1 DUF2690 domain-containing protein [Streptomyces sp. TRM68367]
MTTSSSNDPSTPSTSGSEAQPPVRGRTWRDAGTRLAYAVAIVGAVAAAVLSPLGEHVVKAFLDEPTCPGEACEGKNPQNQGCTEDARTFKPAVGNPTLLQLRYSEECQAVWARIERGNPGDVVTVEAARGAKRSAEIEYGDDKYTSMVRVGDGEFQVTACAVPKVGGKSTFKHYCIHASEATAWQ